MPEVKQESPYTTAAKAVHGMSSTELLALGLVINDEIRMRQGFDVPWSVGSELGLANNRTLGDE